MFLCVCEFLCACYLRCVLSEVCVLFEKCVLSGSSIRVSYLSGESAFDLTSLRPPVCLIHDYKIKMGGGGD